jgi:hypothetical protein
MATVEGGDIGVAKLAHGQRCLARFVGADEQMQVVAEQNAGVDSQAMFRDALARQAEMVASVVVIQKDGSSIDFQGRRFCRFRLAYCCISWSIRSRMLFARHPASAPQVLRVLIQSSCSCLSEEVSSPDRLSPRR